MTDETIQDEPEEQPEAGPTGCKCGCEVEGDHDECGPDCAE